MEPLGSFLTQAAIVARIFEVNADLSPTKVEMSSLT
jgi:hypothetical protein